MAPRRKSQRKKASGTSKKTHICKTRAMRRYGLNDADLRPLQRWYTENPYDRSWAPMQLFLIADVQEAAKKKQERLEKEKERAEEIAAEKAQAAKERRAAAAEAAKEAVQSFAGRSKTSRHGGVVLPDVVLARIMSCLADSLEPGGLRGPDRVTKDLAAAAVVSWDFYHAAKTGFRALADAIGARLQQTKQRCAESVMQYDTVAKQPEVDLSALPGSLGWAVWDQVVGQPMQLKLPQLKEAAKLLGLMVTGTKAELVLRLLTAFTLTTPAPGTPAQLITTVLLERSHKQRKFIFVDGPDRCSALIACISKLEAAGWSRRNGSGTAAATAAEANVAASAAIRGSKPGGVAAARRAFAAAGFASLQQLQQAVRSLSR